MGRYLAISGILILAAAFIQGCGGDDGGVGVTIPAVTATVPADGATGVAMNTSISVTFSREMEASTLDSIYVNGRAAYRVVYNNAQKTATAYLDSMLGAQTVCQVKVSSYCMDKSGNNLSGDHEFSFTTGDFGCDELEDPFADAMSIATAAEVDFNTRYKLLPSCGGQGAMHYFKLVLSQATMITAKYRIIDADTTQVSWRLYFKRADEEDYTSQGSSPVVADHHEYSMRYSFLPGTYYIKTGKEEDTGHTAVYEIEFEDSEACADDAYEDNDFFDEATPVTPGTLENLRSCYTDDDYYSIDLTTGQTITVTLDAPGTSGTLRRVWIYNPSNMEMGRYNGYGNPVVLERTAYMDGTHYVCSRWWIDDVDYNLTIEVTGP